MPLISIPRPFIVIRHETQIFRANFLANSIYNKIILQEVWKQKIDWDDEVRCSTKVAQIQRVIADYKKKLAHKRSRLLKNQIEKSCYSESKRIWKNLHQM